MERMLAGRVAVVTGGSRGIGAGVCRRLAHAGAAVVVSGRDRDAIEAVTGSITASGDRAVGITADATSGEALEHLRAETERTFGPADIVLPFAGGGGEPRRFDETTLEAWNATVETNLTATFLTLRAFVPGMMRRGSSREARHSPTVPPKPASSCSPGNSRRKLPPRGCGSTASCRPRS